MCKKIYVNLIKIYNYVNMLIILWISAKVVINIWKAHKKGVFLIIK